MFLTKSDPLYTLAALGSVENITDEMLRNTGCLDAARKEFDTYMDFFKRLESQDVQ